MTQELPEGTVTILFTDVVGSTELTNRLGDDAARDILGACDELVRQQVERHRGREVKGTGDGLMLIDRTGPGDREKARELLTEAVAMYTKIGMPKHVEMAETMLGDV